MSPDPTQEPYRSRLLEIADIIDSPCYEGHFNMASWLGEAAERDGHTDKFVILSELSKKLKAQESLHTCGTVACIGGTMELALRRLGIITRRESGLMMSTESPTYADILEYYDLDEDLAHALFYPRSEDAEGDRHILLRDGHRAAKVIRHLAETGEVDWSMADK